MIPLAEITGEKNSDAQTKYNRRIPLSQIVGDTAPQAEPEETGGGFWDTAGNAFDWWKNNSLAGAGFLGGLLAETTGNVAERLGKEFPENSWRRNLLESAGNLAQDAADTMLDYGTKKVYTANGDNFSGAVANQLMSGLTGSYSGLASMIHADKSADALMKARQATENKTPVSTDDLGEYFTNPHGFASDVGQLGGSMAAIAPFMGLAPIGAVTRGVATFGGDAITQALINRGLYGAAKIFAGGAPRAVQYGLTSAPVEGAMEGGETRRELLNRGASEEEATRESLITMGKNIPLLLATNTLEGLAFFSPLKVSNKALQIAGRGAANSAQEQYEEFAQEGIQNAARGEPYSWLPWNGAPNQYEAAERVRYPAALLGGIGGATQAISGTDENQENWKRGDQTSNLTAKQAEVWDAARYASARAKEKFGYDISPELIYKQWAHESGGTNFDSENARYNNNFGGLTQVEPNGEENKQPDGNNYYRHFSNVWEYADAYVDDFIKYYPEISGTKNEREFAGVLKKYGYFGDDLENYVAGMEGIQAPANRTSGNQPRIDFASGLQSAREALDGKQMENGTVGCVEAVTKILSHVHPEFKKMVDDGVVNTVEGENSLHSRLEKMGVEIIPFDESKVAQGDIIFYDGKQTYQHVLVADHKDADGNWRVFGNSSSANKVMEQPLYQGQTPAWIAKVSNLQGSNTQTQSQTQQKETQEAESTKPLFDLNSEDSTTQKLLEQFANEKFGKAIDDKELDAVNFFNSMFDDDSKFQDTPENRQAIATRYGDELNAFVQKNSQTPPQQKPAETKDKAKPESPYDRNTAIIQTGRKYLDELLKKGDEPSRETAWSLNSAIQNNDLAKVENILKQNNVAIPEQNQPQPVERNEPPENILSQKLSPNDKKIKVASAPVKTGNKGKKSRQKQGSALIDLAAQNGIEIPNAEVIALKQGSTKAVQKWRDNLMKTGVFNTTAEQSQTKPVSGETIERKDANGTTIFTPPNYQPPKPSLKERAKSIIERFKAQQNLEREADLANEEDDERDIPFDVSPDTVEEEDSEDEHLLELEGEYWRLTEEEQRLDRLRVEGRRQRDLEREQLKSADRNAKIAAGKDILRTLRSPKYSEVKAKVEATPGLATALGNGSVEAIRQVRNFIAEVDDKALQESQARQAQERRKIEQKIAQIRADQRRSGAQTAQANAQAHQAQEEYQRRQAAQSRQAGEQAQLGLGQAQAQSVQRQADEQTQQTQPAQSDGRRGSTTEVITGSRTPHQVQYRVVEASELNSSHEIDNGSVFANKNYPSEFQPRNRERADMQAQLIRMSNSLNPDDLMDARDVNQGAPVIRNDGVVLNGNGRTAAIRYAYANGKGEAYKNALVGNAKRLGLNADEISKMNQPVLVREITSDLTPEAVQDITGTQTGGARMGASEQAQVDAKKLSRNTLTLFPQNDSVDLTNAESSDFLRAALNDIATLDEINSLTTSNGQISQDGINRVKRALFALAYGDEGLIARMSESTDDNVRGVTNALLNAAPTIAKVQAGMKDGVLHKYDLKAIVDTVKKLSALRDAGKPVSKYLQEQSLFGEDSAEMKEILSFIDKNKRAPNKIAAFLKQVASNIQEQGDPRQGNLFGENKPKPLIDLIKRAREAVENNGEADLFAQEQPAPQKTATEESPAQTKSGQEATEQEAQAEKIFEKFKGNYIADDTPYFAAGLKASSLPLGNENYLSEQSVQKLDEIAQQHGGRSFSGRNGRLREFRFKTTKARDNFIRAAMADGFYATEYERQNTKIAERKRNAEAKAKTQTEIEKIINDAKEDAYKILEADKYPEIKDFIDRQFENPANTVIMTGDVSKAHEFADRLVKNVKSYKDAGNLANGVLVEILNKWETEKRGANRRLSGKLREKYNKAENIVNEYIEKYKKGEVSLEDAREDLNHFLKTGRRKNKTQQDTAGNEQSTAQTQKTSEQETSKPEPDKRVDDAKNFDELIALFKDKYNVTLELPIQKSRSTKINFEAFKECLSGVEQVLDEFPMFANRLHRITTSKAGQRYFGAFQASPLRRLQEIIVNLTLFKESNIEQTKRQIASAPDNSRVADPSFKGTGTHEATHFINSIIQHKIGVIFTRSGFPNGTLVDLAYAEIEKSTQKSLADLRREISDYAKTNPSETIAEAGSDYFAHGEQAKPLSKAIINLLKRIAENPAMGTELLLTSQKNLRECKGVASCGYHGELTSGAALKWFLAHRNIGSPQIQVENALYDTGLRDILSNIRKNAGSLQKWEEALRAHVPDEKIMASSDEWTDARINEAVKVTYIKNALEQIGAKIENGKVSYPDAATKKAAIETLKQYESPDYKLSRNGNSSVDISDVVAPEDLTPQQKLLQSFGEKLGVKVVFFRDKNGDFHGVHGKGVTYINVNSKMPLGKVFWHESMHWLKNNNPKLYQQLVKAAGITDEQRQAYLERTGRTDLLTDAAIDEEIIADQFEDVAKRNGLLQSIAGKNRGLIERVVQWLKDTMNKFIEHFRNPQGKLTTKQSIALAEEFGKIAKDLVDPNGQKIFRYNRRTHNIELADGRSLDSVKSNDEKYSVTSIAPPKTKKNAVTVTGNEFGEYSDIKDLREKAIAYYRQHLQGTSVFNEELGRIDIDKNGLVEFTGEGRKKVKTTSAQKGKLLLVKHLPVLIREARQVKSTAPKKERHKDDLFYDMSTEANIDGKLVPVHITLVKHNTGRIQFYNHTIETENAPVNSAEPVSSNEALGLPPVGALSDETIAQSQGEIKYSIGRSDNSSESLVQKIRNAFATWWKGDPKKNRNREITDLLYRTTGYKVDFGNVKDADQTIIDDVHKVIRTKHAYEWDKLLPQIGGKIAKSLKLNPTQEMSNYIADWCLTGAVGNQSAEAKAFEKAMRDDPVTAGLMLQIRDAFQEFHDMTAQEKIGDTLVSRLQGKSPREIAKTLWSEKEEQLTDDLHPVLRQINEMIAKAEKTSPTLAKMMKEDINPYQMMRLLRGVGGLGELMLHSNAENIEDVRNLLGTLYPRLKFDRLNSLDMIVDMAGGKEHVDGLMKFAVAKLDKEMHEKLREDPDADLRPQFSEAVDDEVIQAGEKQYSAAHRALITYSNILACIQHDAGLITDSEFGKLMRGWKNYVPMIRVFEDGEEFKLADSLKPKTGSKRNTYNIWETLTQNTYATLSRAERNKAIQQLAFYARIGEFGDIVQEVETSNPGKNIIHFRENGEIKYLKVFDPAVVRAVENIYSPADTAWIMKFLKATMGFVRAMRTLASADFAIGNPFRDMQDAYIHNRHADANPFVALLNAFREGFKGFGFKRMFKEKSLVPHDTDWAEFNALGGTQSTFVSEDVDQLRRSMNKIYRKTKSERFNPFKSGFVGAFKNILDSMQWLSEQTEYMTRLNSYKRAKAELAKQRPDGKATLADKKLAALEARDASIDFAKAGTSTRKFNRLVMFANAQVQDWAKWGVIGRDLAKGGEAREIALQKIGRLMLTGVLATIAQAALNYSDDDRREKYKKRPDWEKETYWIFADGLRIPKGQDIGTRFVSALTDEFIGKAMDDDPVSTKRLLKVITNAIPSIIPSLIEPAYEVHMNYSSFRDAPIVPVGQQNLDKAEQYGKNTSSFAKLFGELTGWISPRGVDYLISGYLGSTGKFVSRLPDYFTRGGTIDDVLMLRRFVFDPNENPKTVKDYYEAYNEQYKHYNTYKLQRKWDKNAQPPSGYDPKLYARLKSVSSTLRKISAAENNILRNPNLDWDTKNEKLRELEKKRERLCERAMQQAH